VVTDTEFPRALQILEADSGLWAHSSPSSLTSGITSASTPLPPRSNPPHPAAHQPWPPSEPCGGWEGRGTATVAMMQQPEAVVAALHVPKCSHRICTSPIRQARRDSGQSRVLAVIPPPARLTPHCAETQAGGWTMRKERGDDPGLDHHLHDYRLLCSPTRWQLGTGV
jgi:hypothetical protein